MSRFLSNSLILALFCAGFYLMTAGINWLSSDENNDRTPELSFDRRQADEFWKQRKYSRAADHFANLTIQDPYNGNAWFMLANCYSNLRFSYIRTIARETDPKRTRPDLAKIEQCKLQIQALDEKAIPAYERAMEFQRHRNTARVYLARIYAFQGDREKALQYLTAAIDDGYVSNPRSGLDQVFEFKSIQDTPEFQVLLQRATPNTIGTRGTRR